MTLTDIDAIDKSMSPVQAPTQHTGESQTKSKELDIIHIPNDLRPTSNILIILPATTDTSIKLKPQPKLKSSFQPIIRIPQLTPPTLSTINKLSTRQRRRIKYRSSHHVKEIKHRFWAPPIGLGGKSEGSGYGWRGSNPGRREMDVGYVRS